MWNERPTPRLDVPDEATTRRWHVALLRKVARGGDPVLAEMAREVLSGKTTLRDAATSLAYRDKFAELGARLIGTLRGMSQEEIQRDADQRSLTELIDELERDERQGGQADPPTTTEPAAHVTDADEDLSQSSVLQTPTTTPRGFADGPRPQRARWTRSRAH